MRRVDDGRFAHLHLQSVLQQEGLEAHQKTNGDGAQGHQQAQSDGKPWMAPLDHGPGRALTHRLAFPDTVVA